jgi:hypothetical protein
MRIEHEGMAIQVVVYPDRHVEIHGVDVSDWDVFADEWGANGKRPRFASSVENLLDWLVHKEWRKIEKAALVERLNDGPTYDEYDLY